jgi:hypothetical protein
MSAAGGDPVERAATLQAELDAVKRREASFRAKMVHEFLERGERNTYMHTLREERAALVKRGQEASSDLEVLTRKLEASSQRAEAAQSEIERIKASFWWRIARMFVPAPAPVRAPRAVTIPPAEGGAFTYYFHTSPFRIYRGGTFTLRGWAWPEAGGAITAIRANLDGRLFAGRLGREEPEVIARYGPQPANPKPGFEVSFETLPGRHMLAIEAQVAGAEWRTIMCTSIWCEPGSP